MKHLGFRRTLGFALAAALVSATTPGVVAAQRGDSAPAAALPSIADKTAGMEHLDGFLPLYWDAHMGQLWMEIPAMGVEMIHFMGFGAGLGSNDLGIDRGALRGSRTIQFERVGRKILMVQPNHRFRADSDNPDERRAVRDAFARSIVWDFAAAAETDGRVLVDATPFLLADQVNAAGSMRSGTYRVDPNRSTVFMEMTDVFPTNTEMEAELTFVSTGAGGGGGFRGGGIEGVGSVASTGSAASIRIHHSFVALPDDDFEARMYDPRAGYGASSYEDYAAPLGEEMTRRSIRRHRLEKRDPGAAMSEPVEPIIYYLDPGTPEPIRSALLEGARWWNQAFEAAGYINAFQVVMRPDSISSLDARYNVINWVHRSTRGWSTGGSVTDPRTGEIIKGVVTLGSLRVRQDYMMAEGMLSPYAEGDETPPELSEWALARIRQLGAHEVGHTIGLGHNYYNSTAGRISVMDYPHPLVTLDGDGSLDYSQVYDTDIGEWDKVAIRYGYTDFVEGTDEEAELKRILQDAWDDDLRYMTNQDIGTTPQADQWANGTDMAAELDRMMDVRAAAMSRFGEAAIRGGRPMATIEETLVPLYMYHRYQVESTASAVGGVEYVYATRGDGLTPYQAVSADAQMAAFRALLRTLQPSELALPRSVIALIPPRPPGYGRSRETFPRYTGGRFDAVTPAVVAASLTVNNLLTADRAARLEQQAALDPNQLSLQTVLGGLMRAAFGPAPADAYEAQIQQSIQAVIVDRMMWLAANADMYAARATTNAVLHRVAGLLAGQESAHAMTLAEDIQRFLERPAAPIAAPDGVEAPPGAPIGQPAMNWLIGSPAQDWLGLTSPWCSWDGGG